MAENSWPFNEGDGASVDQVRWQKMAAAFSPSGVIGKATDSALSVAQNLSSQLPRTVDVQPGKAFVKGFCYESDSAVTLQFFENPDMNPRIDLVVLELDMSKGIVRLATVKGSPASTPLPPSLTQELGGVWQIAIAECTIASSATSVSTIYDQRVFIGNSLPQVHSDLGRTMMGTPGDIVYARDSVGGEAVWGYAGNGGWSPISNLGPTRKYRPELHGLATQDGIQATGHFQWVGSNMCWVTANLQNVSGRDLRNGTTPLSVSLPHSPRGGITQLMNVMLYRDNGGADSLMLHNGNAWTGGWNLAWMSFPNTDWGTYWLQTFPKDANLWLTGLIEMDLFHEGNS
ncbi:hypothetical protein [Kitasatospora sp. NPDC127116]|uniref:hypothetical protein n=1 Tax=Kitasatospora sp. NPDC127116 TaxID=3345367 RepID=UPI0036430060